MLKLKKNALPIMSTVALVGILALGMLGKLTVRNDYNGTEYYVIRYVVNMLIAVAAFIPVSLLLKDRHIYKTVPFLSIPVFLVYAYQIIFESYKFLDFLSIGSYALMTCAFVSVPMFLTVKFLNTYKTVSLLQFFVALCPVIAVMICMSALNREWIALIMFAVVCLLTFKCKKEKKLDVHWAVLATIAVVILILAVLSVCDSNYRMERIVNIITRGQDDPNGAGWVRNTVDNIFRNSSLFDGCVDINNQLSPEFAYIFEFSDLIIASLIGAYGWFPVICLTVLFIVFFIGVFLMVKKTRQSKFAHNISFVSASYLFIYTIHSYISIFLLDCSGMPTTFLYGNTADMMAVILFGVIIALYAGRYSESELDEYSKDDFFGFKDLYEKVKNFFVKDFDIDYDEDDTDDKFSRILFQISDIDGSNMSWQIFRTVKADDIYYHFFVNKNGKYGIMKQLVLENGAVYYCLAGNGDVRVLSAYIPDDLSDDEKNGISEFAKNVYTRHLIDDENNLYETIDVLYETADGPVPDTE